MKFRQSPLEIDCTGLSKKLTDELADKLSACFYCVSRWDNDYITAECPRSHTHYNVAWNIVARYGVTAK